MSRSGFRQIIGSEIFLTSFYLWGANVAPFAPFLFDAETKLDIIRLYAQ